jgi:hypothetical protein
MLTYRDSDPKRLCEFLLQKCQEKGVTLHAPERPCGLDRDSSGRISGLKVLRPDGSEIASAFQQKTFHFH